MGSVSLITARGCPYTCTWCSHSVFGYSHRRRSPSNVVDEVEHIVDTYHPDLLWYADDVFTINHKWLYEYADEMERRGFQLPFETISREDRLNEDVVKTLARLGCYRLWIGAESGSQKVLDLMKRRTNAERVRDMVHLLKKHGIEVGMFIMLGYDGEERSDLEATVEHLKEAGPDTFLTTVAYPIKGTPYYQTVADRVIARQAWDDRLRSRLHHRRPPLAALLPVRDTLDGQRSGAPPPAPQPDAQLSAHRPLVPERQARPSGHAADRTRDRKGPLALWEWVRVRAALQLRTPLPVATTLPLRSAPRRAWRTLLRAKLALVDSRRYHTTVLERSTDSNWWFCPTSSIRSSSGPAPF